MYRFRKQFPFFFSSFAFVQAAGQEAFGRRCFGALLVQFKETKNLVNI